MSHKLALGPSWRFFSAHCACAALLACSAVFQRMFSCLLKWLALFVQLDAKEVSLRDTIWHRQPPYHASHWYQKLATPFDTSGKCNESKLCPSMMNDKCLPLAIQPILTSHGNVRTKWLSTPSVSQLYNAGRGCSEIPFQIEEITA